MFIRVRSIRLVFLTALLVWAAAAQEFRSTIAGQVTDAQQAVVPGVKISCVEVQTGARSETVSGADGQYALPMLTPGGYEISAEAAGFKRFVRRGIQAGTNERVRIDIMLEIGELAESVTVTSEAPMLQTATASTGQVITSRQIENMPLNGRTPLVLAQLSYGVVPSGSTNFTRPFDNGGPSGFSMGGAPNASNELLMDGAPDTQRNNSVAYNPPVDAVSEVKVETFQADAAYGHSGGGTVNVVLRGGTNSFHGSAYEFNQVSRLAATPFFVNKAGLKKPVSRYNQWGATAGGPVMAPRLFDGRNRLFFFFAYEGVDHGLPRPTTYTVPTAAGKTGDLSQLLRVSANYQLYDPATGAREGSRIRRQPFAGNIVPSNRINPVARKLLDYYGPPNQPGAADGQNNFLANLVEMNKFNNQIGRLDVNVSERHKFFWNFRHNERGVTNENLFDNIATGNTAYRRNWGSMLDDVYSFTPTVVLNTRLNWTRFAQGRSIPSEGFDFTQLGFPSYVAAAAPIKVMPNILTDRFAPLNSQNVYAQPYDNFQIFSSLLTVRGRHNLKLGADLRLFREYNLDFGTSPSGSYSFSTAWTRGPLDNSPAATLGQDLAALLLGLPTGGTLDNLATRANQTSYYALFVQDDWRPRTDLTLNLGLRYERDLPTTERYNRNVAGFDFATPSPVAAQAQAAYARAPIPELPAAQFRPTGGLLFAGPGNRGFYKPGGYFSPRAGFAWTPGSLGGNTVIRGGFGVFVFSLGMAGINQVGFDSSTPVVPTLDSYLTPYSTLSNPFPDGFSKGIAASAGIGTYVGRGVSFYNPNPLNGYSARWNLDIQRQLTKNLLFEIGYIGNHAVHLGLDQALSTVPASFYSTLPTRDQANIDRMTANVTNPFAGLAPGTSLSGSTVQRQQLLRTYPHFSGVTAQARADGSSYFQMMQTQLIRRFSSGLQFLFNYQFSRQMERMNRLNEFLPQLDKRVGSEDRPHRLVWSGSYDLPFGKNGKGLAARVTGGWVVNGVYTYQKGAPLSWGELIYYGGDLKLNSHAVDGAFDTTRFNTRSNEQRSWAVRTFPTRFSNLRQDSVQNYDFSVLKNTRITEKLALQYRCEFFDLLNRPVFGAPDRSPTSSAFGRISSQANAPRSIQMALRLNW